MELKLCCSKNKNLKLKFVETQQKTFHLILDILQITQLNRLQFKLKTKIIYYRNFYKNIHILSY